MVIIFESGKITLLFLHQTPTLNFQFRTGMLQFFFGWTWLKFPWCLIHSRLNKMLCSYFFFFFLPQQLSKQFKKKRVSLKNLIDPPPRTGASHENSKLAEDMQTSQSWSWIEDSRLVIELSPVALQAGKIMALNSLGFAPS